MSDDCTFNFHISSLSKNCANLSGWTLRPLYTIYCITLLTLINQVCYYGYITALSYVRHF